MKRTALILLYLFLLVGCANSFRNDFNKQDFKRCYVVDSTQNISKSDYEGMFKKIESRESKIGFPECDTSDLPDFKIKPLNSSFIQSNIKKSYIDLGVDLASIGTGFWLTYASAASGDDFYLLMGLIHPEPVVWVNYAIRKRINDGHFEIDTLYVEDQAWFKDENQSRQLILNTSQNEIIRNYFIEDNGSDLEPDKNRISINVVPLLMADKHGGWYIEPHYERLLPQHLALDISPGEYIPFSPINNYHDYWIEAGPKWYFLWDLLGIKKHSGLFVGIEGFYQDLNDQIWEHEIGVPITFGSVWQGKWISVSLDWGIGPEHVQYENNSYGLRSHYKTLYLDNLSFGYNF